MASDTVISSASGDIRVADFEAAAWLAMNPPPKTSLASSSETEYNNAKTFIEALSGLPDTPLVCAQLLYYATTARGRFCALQALEAFVSSAAYMGAGADDGRVAMRNGLLQWAAQRGDALYEEPSYVRTKLAVVLGCIVKNEVLTHWPTAVNDIIAALTGFPAGIDLFLRICAAIQQEVVDQHSSRSAEEQAHNNKVKDALRDSGGVAALVDVWFELAAAYVETRPCLVALSLGVLSEFVSWIDVGLVLTEDYRNMFSALIVHPRVILRAATARVMHRLLYKGMDDLSRLALVNMLGVDALLGGIIDQPALLVSDEESPEGWLPGEKDASHVLETLTDGHQHFGLIFAELAVQTGRALINGGEQLNPALQVDACTWTANALRTVVGVALRLIADHSPNLACRAMPLLSDVVACFAREMKYAGAYPGRALSSPAITGVSGVGLSVPPIDGDGSAFPKRRARSGRSRSGSGIGPGDNSLSLGSAASALLKSQIGSAAAVLTSGGFGIAGAGDGGSPGRPGGVGMEEFIPRLLDLLPLKYTYPKDFIFNPLSADDEEDEEDDELDEGTAIRNLRDLLRRMYLSILKVAPDAAYSHLSTTIFAPERLADLENAPWNEAECICGLLFAFLDGAPQAQASIKSSTPLQAALVTVLTRGIPQRHTHVALLHQYYELVARYVPPLISVKPEILPQVFMDMIGTGSTSTGLRHVKPQVRSRVAYLLLKLVKAIMKEDQAAILEELTDPLLSGINEFLDIPFVPREPGSLGPGALMSPSAAETETRGTSGLGSTDQQYLFELAGALIGAKWMTIENKVAYTNAILQPLLKQVEDGLGYLGATDMAPLDLSSHSPEMLAAVGSWLCRMLNAIGHLTKGFGNVSSIEPLVEIEEQALGCAMRALATLPSHAEVRSRSVFMLHRMIDCLDARILVHVPACMPLLLTAETPDGMVPVLTFLQQLTAKFKDTVAPFIAENLGGVLERVFAVMPPPPPLRPPPAIARRTLRSSTALFGDASGDAAAPVSLVDDDARSRSDLQKALAGFVQSIVTTHLAASVFLCPQNYPIFNEVLNVMSGIIGTVVDLSIAKTVLSTLAALLRHLFPIAALTAPTGQAILSPAAILMAPVHGPAPTSAPASLPIFQLAAEPSPCRVPEGVQSDVMGAVLELVCKAPLMLSYAPNFAESDAASLLAVAEGAALLVTLCIHLGAHSSPPNPDAIVELVASREFPAAGVSVERSGSVGEQLFNALRLPPAESMRDASLKGALLAAVIDLRRAALSAIAGT